jgi:hypothetical protein
MADGIAVTCSLSAPYQLRPADVFAGEDAVKDQGSGGTINLARSELFVIADEVS